MVKFYPDPVRTGYEELLTYYPKFYRDVFEMNAILKYFGGICDRLEEGTQQAYFNYFILQADEETIAQWERVLGIRYSEDLHLTLEQRRQVVLSRLCARSHVGEPEIRTIIGAYTPNGVWVDFDKGIIYVVIQGEVFDENNLVEALLEKIPAHLRLDMKIEIRRESRMDLNINYGSIISNFLDFQPVDVQVKSVEEKKSKSGAFYRTRVKSKLIG